MPELIAQSTYSRPTQKRRKATKAELGAWREFLRAGAEASAALETVLGPTGISHSEYEVLLHLSTAPREGLRPTELAERVLLTKSGLTRLLDRLVERGYVERRPCPGDRRGHLLVLTVAGRRIFRRATPRAVRAIGALFAEGFSDHELAVLRQASERLADAAKLLTEEASA